MIPQSKARIDARNYSLEHRGKPYCIYRIHTGDHWVCQHDVPRSRYMGAKLTFVTAYRDGIEVNPTLSWTAA